MKKILALLLALCMVLALCACGEAAEKDEPAPEEPESAEEPTPTEEPEPEEIIYNIGDPVQTDVAEVVVTEVNFSEKYSICKAASGYQFVTVTFSIKNIGKETMPPIRYDNTYTMYLYQIPYVDYNDGYIFKVGEVTVRGETYHVSCFASNEALTDSLQPLSEAVTITSAIYVPEEVVTNTDAPLLIRVRVPSSGDAIEFAYKVR